MVLWMQVEFAAVHDGLGIVVREVRTTHNFQGFNSFISYRRKNTEFLFSLSSYVQDTVGTQ